MSNPSRSRRRVLLWVVACAAMLIVTIVLRWRFWPYREVGDGAMAPSHRGPHVLAQCDNCGFELALGIFGDPEVRRRQVVRPSPCPNCGAACPVPPDDEAEPGDNSPNCVDSRQCGPVAADNILGVVQNLSR